MATHERGSSLRRASGYVRAYEVSLSFMVAAVDLEHARDLQDRVVDYADGLTLGFEYGSTTEIKPEDVMAGSPIARDIERKNRKLGEHE